MKRTVSGTFAVAALLLLLSAGSALADTKGMMSRPDAPGAKSAPARQGMHGMHGRKHLVRHVIRAVSKTGISTKQAAAVTDAVNTYKMRQMQLRGSMTMPIDAFGDSAFDAALFKQMKQKRFDAMVGAEIDLFKSVYAVLTPEQRTIFKREFTAPMVEKLIKKDMIKGHMMPGKAMGQGAGMGSMR